MQDRVGGGRADASLAGCCDDLAPASQRALRRQLFEVGAVCRNSARTDLGAAGNWRNYRDKTLFWVLSGRF